MPSGTVAGYVDVIGLVVRKPRTIPELVQLTGMHQSSISRLLTLLVEEGLVWVRIRGRRKGVPGKPPREFAWRAKIRGNG